MIKNVIVFLEFDVEQQTITFFYAIRKSNLMTKEDKPLIKYFHFRAYFQS